MSSDLQIVLAKVKALSGNELLTVLESVTTELRQKGITNGNTQPGSVAEDEGNEIYYATPQEVEADLIALFGAERLAQIRTEITGGILNNLPTLPKSLSEYINEDREDRL